MAESADSVYWQLLVVRCQVGDRIAIEELIARCQPRLRGFLFKLLAGKVNVDDLAQDVWMDVFHDLPRLANPGAFLPWFYRIARNRAYRILRSKPPENHSIEDFDVAQQSTESAEFTLEDAAAVHAAMDRLTPQHREVLLLRFMEDMSYHDIAAVAGCNIGTVRSRIHNAKQLLRKIIQDGEST